MQGNRVPGQIGRGRAAACARSRPVSRRARRALSRRVASRRLSSCGGGGASSLPAASLPPPATPPVVAAAVVAAAVVAAGGAAPASAAVAASAARGPRAARARSRARRALLIGASMESAARPSARWRRSRRSPSMRSTYKEWTIAPAKEAARVSGARDGGAVEAGVAPSMVLSCCISSTKGAIGNETCPRKGSPRASARASDVSSPRGSSSGAAHDHRRLRRADAHVVGVAPLPHRWVDDRRAAYDAARAPVGAPVLVFAVGGAHERARHAWHGKHAPLSLRAGRPAC